MTITMTADNKSFTKFVTGGYTGTLFDVGVPTCKAASGGFVDPNNMTATFDFHGVPARKTYVCTSNPPGPSGTDGGVSNQIDFTITAAANPLQLAGRNGIVAELIQANDTSPSLVRFYQDGKQVGADVPVGIRAMQMEFSDKTMFVISYFPSQK